MLRDIMQWTHHLHLKIILVMLLTVGIIISISTYDSMNETREILIDQLDSQGNSLSQTLANFVIEDLLSWNYPAIQSAIEHTGKSDSEIMAIRVYHEDTLVANYSSSRYCGKVKTSQEDPTACIAYEAPVIVEVSGEEKKLGHVTVILSEDRYHAFLEQEITSLILSGLLLLSVITVLTYLSLNRLILTPIKSIEEGARIIGEGNLNYHINVKSEDEIGRLARAFNAMTNNLKLSRDETEDYKKHLEEKVEVRTKELREAYEKLKELDNLKSEFFANISHELRTPLTLILAPLESMKQGEVGSFTGEQIDFIDIMHKNTLRLLRLINNLLDFSKIEAGKMKISFEKQDIAKHVASMVESAIPSAEKKGIDLILETDKDIQPIYFDREKVEKIFFNLLSNALKFTPKVGKITVEVRDKDDVVSVSVTDTGMGISKKDQGRLFNRFAQVDASSHREYEGTGIGLALAKELTELHKGRIYVNSTVGEGSTFTFELLKGESHIDKKFIVKHGIRELKVDEEKRIEDLAKAISDKAKLELVDIMKEETSVKSKKVSGRPTVLIIEDNPDMVRFIARLLGDEYNVLTASDGIEGMETVNNQIPDLVISDIMMPRKDGYQVCKEIKSGDKTKHIPVILLTAKAEMSMKIEGLKYGADDYLIKPFNSKELRARVKSLLNLREMETEIQQRNQELENSNKKLQEALENLKITQKQFIQSEKMATVGMLAGGVAHEINNPMSAILTNAQLLLRNVKDKRRKESLQLIEESARRCSGIIRNLLSYSRKQELDEFKSIDVNKVIKDTCNLLKRQLKDENITIETEYGSILPIDGNANELQQVFTNLILNSRDAIKEKGKSGNITIRTSQEDAFIILKIIDKGSGISKENMSKLFDPFFTTKAVGKGTGLGLPIIYNLVKKHEGVIDFSSELGKGTTVTIKFTKGKNER